MQLLDNAVARLGPAVLGQYLEGFMADLNIAENLVRVLIIEDDPDDRDLLLYQLRKGGMDNHVKFISDGQEAFDFLMNLNASTLADELIAIFLDLKLPSLGGLELLRYLRLQDSLQSIPVIVMTSSNDPKEMEECCRLKVSSYIPKPITFTSFSKAVADVFHRPKIEANQ